jgi:hypothetical protein
MRSDKAANAAAAPVANADRRARGHSHELSRTCQPGDLFGDLIHVGDAPACGMARLSAPYRFLPTRRLKMTTDIEFSPSVEGTPLNPSRSHPFSARVGFRILMLWAFVMLSIGAAAHFGAPSPEYSILEFITLP